jgi:hypothetical protein
LAFARECFNKKLNLIKMRVLKNGTENVKYDQNLSKKMKLLIPFNDL